MTEVVFIIYMTLTGAAVGSFLNVAMDRLPKGESLVRNQSHCDSCHRPIAYYDLVPLFNYLWLRGQCRYCKAKIPLRVPLVEATTGVFFGWTAYQFGISIETFVTLLNICVFIVIFFIDLEHRLILNKVLLVSLPVMIALFPLGSIGSLHSVTEAYLRVISGVSLGLGVMLVIYIISRAAMGEGDVKMGALMGAAAGFPQVLAAFFIAFVTSGIVALALMGLKGMSRKDFMPFGPFLAAAVIAVLLARDNLYSWYLNLFSGLGG